MVAVPALKLPVAWGPAGDSCGTVVLKKTADATGGQVSTTNSATRVKSFTNNNVEALTARDVALDVQAVTLGNSAEYRSAGAECTSSQSPQELQDVSSQGSSRETPGIVKASFTTGNVDASAKSKCTETESANVAATGDVAFSLFDTNVELPRVSYVYKQTSLKGEDNAMAAVPIRTWGSKLNMQLFGVFDGHNGCKASQYCKRHLVRELLPRLPKGPMPAETKIEAFEDYLSSVRDAVLDTFLALNRKIVQSGTMAGCTASIVLLTGWVATVANVGDSSVTLDTADGGRIITGDHRLERNASEVERLQQMGYTVARVNSTTLQGPAPAGDEGFGPLRIWPGGINLSRAIGDSHAGEGLLPYPYISQVKLPTTGARFVMASDGVWDAKQVSEELVFRLMRSKSLKCVAQRLLQTATKPLADDTTLFAIDVLPKSMADYADSSVKVSGGYCLPMPLYLLGGYSKKMEIHIKDTSILQAEDTLREGPYKLSTFSSLVPSQGQLDSIKRIFTLDLRRLTTQEALASLEEESYAPGLSIFRADDDSDSDLGSCHE